MYIKLYKQISLALIFVIFQKQIQMQKNQGPQPERFQVYTELPSGTGFKISGTDHIFYYDRHGGWKDQYGNYYNSDGQPDEEPDSNSEKSVSQDNWSSSEEDQFQKEFGPKADIQQEFQKQQTKAQQIHLTIAKNVTELQHHIAKQPLRVNFQILDLQKDEVLPSTKQLVQSYRKKVKGVINAFYDVVEDVDQNTGYFVLTNVEQADKLIHLQGQNIVGHDVSFDVQTFDELKIDPLSELQLENTLQQYVDVSKDQKLYVLSYENGDGFTCDKKVFMKWFSGLKLNKNQIVKMKKNDKQQRKPTLKLNQDQVKAVLSSEFQGKKLKLLDYVPSKREQQKQETQQPQKKQEQKQTEPPKKQQQAQEAQKTE